MKPKSATRPKRSATAGGMFTPQPITGNKTLADQVTESLTNKILAKDFSDSIGTTLKWLSHQNKATSARIQNRHGCSGSALIRSPLMPLSDPLIGVMVRFRYSYLDVVRNFSKN